MSDLQVCTNTYRLLGADSVLCLVIITFNARLAALAVLVQFYVVPVKLISKKTIAIFPPKCKVLFCVCVYWYVAMSVARARNFCMMVVAGASCCPYVFALRACSVTWST